MPHGGLALANSVATALEATVLLYLMRRRLTGLAGKFVLAGALKGLAAALAMSLVVWGWLNVFSGSVAWLVAGGGIVIGGGVFLIVTLLLKVPEIWGAARLVAQRAARVMGRYY